MSGGGRNAAPGFTILELVAGLVLLGILSVVAVALYDDGNADAVAEAETFKSHLRYAQIRAMGDVDPWTIVVTAPDTYALYKGPDASGTPQNLPGESGATHTVRDGVSVSGGTFTFDWRGRATVGGGTGITFDGDPDIVVTVQAETGFAQ